VLVFSRAAAREVDLCAAKEFAIPTILLMENAARNIADIALDGLEGVESPRVLVLCGPGNNGGDGLAAARHLHNAGLTVHVALAFPIGAATGDAAINLGIVQRMGLPITRLREDSSALDRLAEKEAPDLLIDALFGTGLSRPLEGPMKALVEAVNRQAGRGMDVLSVDLPSGMDADTGEALGCAVRANVTVTFGGLKAGFLSLEAQSYLGEVVVVDIGVPRELLERLAARPPHHPEPTPTGDSSRQESGEPPKGRGRRRD
jgi:hydroxyethylthiazole kinase-like uncharacterized protein yjeF